MIEDSIKKLNDKSTHIESRQFYHATLSKIHKAVGAALEKYENEKKFK